jgi:glycosyltransferase involved in cell wall biosynthesis
MIVALQKLGHKVPFQSPTAPVEIFFSQPDWYEFTNSDQYHIGYTPWESTGLPAGWLEGFNNVDEVWTPSPVTAQWFKEAGVDKEIRVYEHGIEPIWRPKRRKTSDKIRFLHHGEPAPRKAGQMALDAFRAAFGDRDDVHLTIKAHHYSTIRAFDSSGSIIGLPENVYKNVSVHKQEFDLELELIPLYQKSDVLVYPSFGEGFGLIPLQAMGTGAAVICTEAWAPYKRFIQPGLALGSTLGDTPWVEMHPGKLFWPDFDELVEIYRYTADNIDTLRANSYRDAFKVHEEYDWVKLTERAFAHIVDKFG